MVNWYISSFPTFAIQSPITILTQQLGIKSHTLSIFLIPSLFFFVVPYQLIITMSKMFPVIHLQHIRSFISWKVLTCGKIFSFITNPTPFSDFIFVSTIKKLFCHIFFKFPSLGHPTSCTISIVILYFWIASNLHCNAPGLFKVRIFQVPNLMQFSGSSLCPVLFHIQGLFCNFLTFSVFSDVGLLVLQSTSLNSGEGGAWDPRFAIPVTHTVFLLGGGGRYKGTIRYKFYIL